MQQCSLSQSEEAKNWPDAVISVKLTMNPYLLAMAIEESLTRGIKLWELINSGLWEKLGKPDHDTLMEFAANMEVDDLDPKWKKRLKLTARHEVEVAALKRAMEQEQDLSSTVPGPESNGSSD